MVHMRTHCLHILCSSEMSMVFLGWTKAKPTKQTLAFLCMLGYWICASRTPAARPIPWNAIFQFPAANRSCSRISPTVQLAFCHWFNFINQSLWKYDHHQKTCAREKVRHKSCTSWSNSRGKVGGLRLPEARYALPTLTWERTVEVSLYIQNHWVWSTPLLASKDFFFFGGTLKNQTLTFHAQQLVWFAKSLFPSALFLARANWWWPRGVLKEHITGKPIWCYSSSRQAWLTSQMHVGTSQKDSETQSPVLSLCCSLVGPPVESTTRAHRCNFNTTRCIKHPWLDPLVSPVIVAPLR